jgi:hypothetical protein
MSKIALSGDASGTGTFTIASPNSNNNRTLTLPDATGTIVVAGGAQTVEFAAGSASAPSVTFTGDTNTGIYSPGADRIGFTEGGVLTGEFDASGNFLFNSGYGSVAVAYGCRAWVNFNGTANTNLSGTYSQSGTTVTVTATSHGLIAGNVIYSDITTGTGVDGTYTVATVTDANTFTYTAGTSLTTSGNITLVRNTIRASGNVSSIADNATGDYTVNFSAAMPDANYTVGGITMRGSVNTDNLLFLPLNGTYTSTACRVLCAAASSSSLLIDAVIVNVFFFR